MRRQWKRSGALGLMSLGVVGLIGLGGCGDDEEAQAEEGAAVAAASNEAASLEDWVGAREGAASAGAPRGAPDPHSPGAMGQMAPEGQPDNVRAVQGTVRERLDAAGYTYLRVQTEGGDVWVAAMGSAAAVDDEVTAVGTLMRDFRSNALDRNFPELLLAGRVEGGSGEASAGAPAGAAAPPGAGAPAGHPPMGGGMPSGHPPMGGGTPSGAGGGMPAGHPPMGGGGAPSGQLPAGHP